MKKSLRFLALCALLIFISGCGGPKYNSLYTRPQFDISKVKRIAVLPIENFVSDRYAGEKIRRTVIIDLLSRGVDIIEPGEVTKVLKELKVTSLGSIPTSDIREIGRILSVDAVMMGSVNTFGISKGVSVSYPEVAIHLTLIEPVSGNIVWSVSNTVGGPGFWTRHFGAEGVTLDATAIEVVKEAIGTLF